MLHDPESHFGPATSLLLPIFRYPLDSVLFVVYLGTLFICPLRLAGHSLNTSSQAPYVCYGYPLFLSAFTKCTCSTCATSGIIYLRDIPLPVSPANHSGWRCHTGVCTTTVLVSNQIRACCSGARLFRTHRMSEPGQSVDGVEITNRFGKLPL